MNHKRRRKTGIQKVADVKHGWYWLVSGTLLIALFSLVPKIRGISALIFGSGGHVLPLAVFVAGILSVVGTKDQTVRFWRKRLLISVLLISFTAAGFDGIAGNAHGWGGIVGCLIPFYLYGFLGVWAYYITILAGLFLIFILLMRPVWKVLKLKHPVEYLKRIVPSLERKGHEAQSDQIESSRFENCGAGEISLRPQSDTAVDKKSSRKMSTTDPQEVSESIFFGNEELYYDVLPAPEDDRQLSLDILTDAPEEETRQAVSDERLARLQFTIQDAVRRVSSLRLEPADTPVVGMTSIRFSFTKVSGQRDSVKKVLKTAEDIGIETGRAPVRVVLGSRILFELPLKENERRFVPIKPLLSEIGPPLDDEDDIRYLIGRCQDGRVFELSAISALHMLVGGATGGGKSVLLHTIIFGLIFRYPPSKVRLVLYDNKIEEFAPYRGLPHLWQEIVTNEGGYQRMLQNLKAEIKRRKMERGNDPEARFVWLVVIMDEFRGLSNDDLVALIAEARSLQIRFILGTQRATKDFIDTSIKANLPTGISFRVRNSQESNLIIGEPGACDLMPHGDCLVHSPSALERIQAGWVKKADLAQVRMHNL